MGEHPLTEEEDLAFPTSVRYAQTLDMTIISQHGHFVQNLGFPHSGNETHAGSYSTHCMQT